MTKGPNIREIASRAGCSAATVSRVLASQGSSGAVKTNEATRRKIMNICAELGYTPSIHAARLFSRRSKVIGFLPSCNVPWDDINLARSLAGACGKLTELGYRCLPLQNGGSFFKNKEYLNIFRRIEIDALIIWGETADAEYLAELTAEKMPFMLLGNRVANYPAVVTDHYDGMRKLIAHCQSLGAKKLVYCDLINGDIREQRRQAFLDQTEGRGTIVAGGLSVKDGYRAAADAWVLRPDAIIGGNDKLAVGIEHYLGERNVRIPRDVLLTGADNVELSEYCAIPLSTFDQRAADCAATCVQSLIDHLENGTALQSVMLPTDVILRASTRR